MTWLFWIIAAAMALIALAILVWPLLKRTPPVSNADRDKTLVVYRQHVVELEQDLKNGVVTDTQYQQARRELEHRLLQEINESEAVQPPPSFQFNSRAMALALAGLVPLVSVLLYLKFGNLPAFTHPTVSTTQVRAGTEYDHRSGGGLDTLAERLKQRLQENPSDGAGWALLARSYVELERHAEGVIAFEKAATIIPDDAQLLADYADALGVIHGRKLDGKPERLVAQALDLDPHNLKALMLAGTIAYDHKDYSRALKYWEQARTELPPDVEPEIKQELTANVNEVRNLIGGSRKVVVSYEETSPTRAASAKQNAAITGKVSVAPGLASKGSFTDTLFVFARAVEGPPMPVAIVRATKKDLPFTFRLDDSNSPMSSRKLSEAGAVEIVARLSKSGDAVPKSGDLQGTSKPVKPGADGIQVVIDTELP